jgi:hypothetical protein
VDQVCDWLAMCLSDCGLQFASVNVWVRALVP